MTTPTGHVSSTKAVALHAPVGRINLPIGMILRCLPPEVLAADISEFDASGAAATEIGLPMNLILGQLPSGKVEMTLQELVPHFPPGYLQPTESITSYLPNLINLPLMDVVMRIPPDLLALRPDQKDVDAAVINMADPFTEEILREQAQAAARNTETNIIDESQVPATEEFVPRDQAPAPKSFITTPPPRPVAPAPIAAITSAAPLPPPMPPASKLPTPPAFSRSGRILPLPSAVRTNSPVPPAAPNSTSRTISPSGRLPAPTRATTPIPARPQAAVTSPVSLPNVGPRAAGSVPTPGPIPGSGALPVPPRPPTVPVPQAPQPPLRPSMPLAAPTVPVLPKLTEDAPAPVAESKTPFVPEKTAETAPSFPTPGQPDAGADDLQRLAALAMQQLNETPVTEETSPALVPTPPAPGVSAQEATQQIAPSEAIAEEAPPLPVESSPSTTQSLSSNLQPAPPAPRSFTSKSITVPMPGMGVGEPEAPHTEPAQAAAPADAGGSLALNLNHCTVEELLLIPGCSRNLAESIVRQRAKIGSFKRLEDLLEVPGMNPSAYSNLTGETPPPSGAMQPIAELLGFPPEQEITLKDVTERISCWPDVTGCILSQKSGLALVGTAPAGLDKASIVAFAPRMFEAINKSFAEISGRETDEIIIPTAGTSFHIFRNNDLYLFILSRLPQMPDRHIKIARLVLAGLGHRPT
jgi:DNA uptake protein ComE-like DNA-binding protein